MQKPLNRPSQINYPHHLSPRTIVVVTVIRTIKRRQGAQRIVTHVFSLFEPLKEEPPRHHDGDEAVLRAENIGFSDFYLVEAPGIERNQAASPNLLMTHAFAEFDWDF